MLYECSVLLFVVLNFLLQAREHRTLLRHLLVIVPGLTKLLELFFVLFYLLPQIRIDELVNLYLLLEVLYYKLLVIHLVVEDDFVVLLFCL